MKSHIQVFEKFGRFYDSQNVVMDGKCVWIEQKPSVLQKYNVMGKVHRKIVTGTNVSVKLLAEMA